MATGYSELRNEIVSGAGFAADVEAFLAAAD